MKRLKGDSVPWSLGDSGVRYMIQGPEVEWGILRMKPGQSSKDYGLHIHHVVEETFYIISGKPKFIVNGETFRAGPGDAIVIEPYDHHNLVNDTQEPFEALFLKHPYMPDDRHPVEET